MQKTYYIFLGIACLVCFLTGFFVRGFVFLDSSNEKSLSLKDVKGESNSKESSGKEGCNFFVDVSGAVINPGVVCLNEGAIVNDAIVKAGGFNPSAYAFKYVAQRINLARILENEEKIYIPFRDDVVCRFPEDAQVLATQKIMDALEGKLGVERVNEGKSQENLEKTISGPQEDTDCISINSASKEKIMELKGIGEARAKDILEGRPYSKLEDLKNVKGIGDKTYENLEPFICL